MANVEGNGKFSAEQILLNERLAASSDRIDRMMISQETMDEIQRLTETDRVKQLVEEFEASPSAQGVLKAFADINAKLDSVLGSKEMGVLVELADAQEKGATDSQLMAMAQAKGARATGEQTISAGSSAQTMLQYLDSTENHDPLKSSDYNKEADGLVFSYLAYVSKFVKDTSVGIDESEYFRLAMDWQAGDTIGSYVSRLREWIDERPDLKKKLQDEDRYLFLQYLEKSRRYNELEIVDMICGREPGVQDLVLAIQYSDKQGIAIAFEGTEGSYIGWETDGDLFGIPDVIPAEKWAMEQLDKILTEHGKQGPVDITGHSRGGHLSIASLILLDGQEDSPDLSVIRSVSAYDAPGFHKDFVAQNLVTIGRYKRLIDNYYISNSVLGMPGEPIGNTKFIAMAEYVIPFLSHESYCWAIDENGNFTLADQSEFSRLFRAITEYALDTLSEEEFDALWDSLLEVLRTGKDGEYILDGMFEFQSLDLALAAWVNRIEKAIELGNTGSETLAKLALNHPATECIGKMKELVSTARKVTDLLARIPVSIPYLKQVDMVLKIIDTTLTVIDFALQAIYEIHKMKQEKRVNAYMSANPVISFRFSDLDAIREKLANANRCVERAGNSFTLLGNERYWRYELADVLTLGFTVLLDAIAWFGLKLRTGGKNRNIEKMKSTTEEIKELWKNGCKEISDQLGVGASDHELKVNPANLSKYAKAMGDELQKAEKHYGETVNAIYALGSKQQWSNDDYDQFEKYVKAQEQQVLSNIRTVAGDCGAMEGAATKYVLMQKESVQKCDSAIHNWWSDFLFW